MGAHTSRRPALRARLLAKARRILSPGAVAPEPPRSLNTADLARAAYRIALNRDPDPDGLVRTRGLLDEGMSFNDLLVRMALSPERTTALRPPDPVVCELVVRGLYALALERDPDVRGLEHGMEVVATAGWEVLALDLLRSQERANNIAGGAEEWSGLAPLTDRLLLEERLSYLERTAHRLSTWQRDADGGARAGSVARLRSQALEE